MHNNNMKFIVNPKTGRSIAVGGRMWRKMVKQGVIDNAESDTSRVALEQSRFDYEKPDTLYTAEEKKNTIVRSIKSRVRVDHDQSQHELTDRDFKIKTLEESQLTADAVIEVIDDIQNNEEQLPANMTRDEAHDYLQGMIFDRMLANKQKFINKSPMHRISRLQPTRRKKQLQPMLRRSKTHIKVRDEPKRNIRTKPKSNCIAKLKPLRRVPKRKPEPPQERVFQEKSQYEYEYEDEDEEDVEDSEEEDILEGNDSHEYQTDISDGEEERFYREE